MPGRFSTSDTGACLPEVMRAMAHFTTMPIELSPQTLEDVADLGDARGHFFRRTASQFLAPRD
jgi:hypothetical protein